MPQKEGKVSDYAVLEIIGSPRKVPQKCPIAPQKVVQTYIEFEEIDASQSVLKPSNDISTSLVSIVSSGLSIIASALSIKAHLSNKKRYYSSLRGLSKKEDQYLATFPKQTKKVSDKNTTNIYVNGDATFTINN